MRVERNFAFLDLCGFTAFTGTQGDERATNVLASFRACVRDIASRRGVRVAKWLGDGAMVVAVEPEPLVAAILEIERRIDDGDSPLALRAGLARGPVILFEGDDYIGTPVNLAARLSDAAGPRQILAVPEFAAFCPPWVDPGEGYSIALPGFATPVDVVRLARRPAGPAPVTDPVCGLTLARMWAVGRGGEWFCSESCAAAWDDHERAAEEPA